MGGVLYASEHKEKIMNTTITTNAMDNKQIFIKSALEDIYAMSSPPLAIEQAEAYAVSFVKEYADGTFAIQWQCFKGIWGHFAHSWDPTSGQWEVSMGRGTWGRGSTLSEARLDEQNQYEADCHARGY